MVQPLQKALLSRVGILLLSLQHSGPSAEWGVGGSEALALSSLWKSTNVGASTLSCIKLTVMARDMSAAPASLRLPGSAPQAMPAAVSPSCLHWG